MDEYTRISHKSYSLKEEEKEIKKIKYLKGLITRILLSIILVISICIFIKVDNKYENIINNYIFKDSLEFTKINKWYQDNFGKVIPAVKDNTDLVFSSNDLQSSKYEKYQDGVKFSLSKNSPVSLLNGGIVVFIGEKDNYGNTLILQGNDGIDYWYGGITNVNVNLYDYLEKDTLIGETSADYLYLVLQKDNQYMSYEEYLK